ncbi:hypothetical protein KHC23_16165 [Ancylobacter dichloromethanicus]|uniref:DUF3108 domain-containing protein n=1 Tax=Ancylobacter dichloromethanicus TaxID=518825 RepID=A0A9W6JA22_9HYPH|nr:hypothetical protein [Ancylobacter dichloromethanicus]MBS7555179.1 hypothetical protein [Ancylobacter dichloromethanicus]GLK73681.1 hypothetical protein GCM10017643_37990 [Ancylobacter dichloromethanicus]
MLRLASTFAAAATFAAFLATAALAAPTASELFFEAPYLSKVEPGTTLTYAYKHVTSEAKLGEGFDETLDMKVSAPADDPSRRVAEVVIHRGEKEGEAGPFPTMNGNPIALILLERDVKEMAQLTKGSPFYLRNRVREHLSSGTVDPARFSFDGREVEGWKLTMRPFTEDPNKDKLLELAGRRYEFLFSQAVPGGLYSIDVVTPKADGSGNIIETSLTLTGASAAPAAK